MSIQDEISRQRFSVDLIAKMLAILAGESMTALQLSDALGCRPEAAERACDILNKEGVIYIEQWTVEPTAKFNRIVPVYTADLQLIRLNAPKPGEENVK